MCVITSLRRMQVEQHNLQHLVILLGCQGLNPLVLLLQLLLLRMNLDDLNLFWLTSFHQEAIK
jgi:hypothetical protein